MSTNKEIKIINNVNRSRYQRESLIGKLKLNDESFTFFPTYDAFVNDKFIQQFQIHVKRNGSIKDFE
jgi:hypothetical protein